MPGVRAFAFAFFFARSIAARMLSSNFAGIRPDNVARMAETSEKGSSGFCNTAIRSFSVDAIAAWLS